MSFLCMRCKAQDEEIPGVASSSTQGTNEAGQKLTQSFAKKALIIANIHYSCKDPIDGKSRCYGQSVLGAAKTSCRIPIPNSKPRTECALILYPPDAANSLISSVVFPGALVVSSEEWKSTCQWKGAWFSSLQDWEDPLGGRQPGQLPSQRNLWTEDLAGCSQRSYKSWTGW